MPNKVYLVYINNDKDYDMYSEWLDAIFSSKDKAIKYVREKFQLPDTITFSHNVYLDGTLGDLHLDADPSDWWIITDKNYGDKEVFSYIEEREVK